MRRHLSDMRKPSRWSWRAAALVLIASGYVAALSTTIDATSGASFLDRPRAMLRWGRQTVVERAPVGVQLQSKESASRAENAGARVQSGAGQSGPGPTDTAAAVVSRYCVSCHNDRLKTANLVLDKADAKNLGADPELWEKVLRKVR